MSIFTKIRDTILGKTQVGKVAHQALPFKKIRSVVGSALLGIKKATPLPELKDPEVRKSVTEATKVIDSQNVEGMQSDQLLALIRQIRDILDDGKMNDSVDDLPANIKTLITQIFSAIPLIAYIVYGILTGDWNFGDFLNYLGSFVGLN